MQALVLRHAGATQTITKTAVKPARMPVLHLVERSRLGKAEAFKSNAVHLMQQRCSTSAPPQASTGREDLEPTKRTAAPKNEATVWRMPVHNTASLIP